MARVCVDSTFFDIDGSGNLTFKRGSVGLQQMLTFTAAGTTAFTKASFPGLTRIRVRVVGGGGGAGGCADAGSAASVSTGGGGGGYSESVISASSLGASETITVGAGGAGGIGGNPGSPGLASSFGGFVSANGGGGSPAGVDNTSTGFADNTFVFGGFAASAGVGQIAVPGGNSSVGIVTSDFTNAPGLGGDAGGGYGTGGQTGANGTGYGGGGGGTGRNAGFPAANGGSGVRGAVFIELFY